MASKQVWEPVPDDHYGAHDTISVMRIGTLLEINSAYGDGATKHNAMIELPDNIRLCQLVESDAPAAVTIPSEVREAIRRLTAYGIPVGCTNADWIRWRETVTKWLDSLPAGLARTFIATATKQKGSQHDTKSS